MGLENIFIFVIITCNITCKKYIYFYNNTIEYDNMLNK